VPLGARRDLGVVLPACRHPGDAGFDMVDVSGTTRDGPCLGMRLRHPGPMAGARDELLFDPPGPSAVRNYLCPAVAAGYHGHRRSRVVECDAVERLAGTYPKADTVLRNVP
jgi:hypothetical protein